MSGSRHGFPAFVLCLLCVHPLLCQPHPVVEDKTRVLNLRELYFTRTESWAKSAVLTPEEQSAMSAGLQWERLMAKGPDDPLAKKVLAAGEPSYQSVSAWYPGKVLDRTLLGTYSDPTKPLGPYENEFTIWWNGAISADLFFGPMADRWGETSVPAIAHNTNVLFRVGADADMYGRVGTRFTRIGYEDGYLPIVVSSYEHQGFRYRQTALAHQPAAETKGWDIAFVRFEITNNGKSAGDAVLSEDILLTDGVKVRAEDRRIVNAAGAVLFTHSDPNARFDPVLKTLTHTVRLAPGATAVVVLKIPYIPDNTGSIEETLEQLLDAPRMRHHLSKLGINVAGNRTAPSICVIDDPSGNMKWPLILRPGTETSREDAFRTLDYVTYFTGSDGRISCCGVDYHNPWWYSDGYRLSPAFLLGHGRVARACTRGRKPPVALDVRCTEGRVWPKANRLPDVRSRRNRGALFGLPAGESDGGRRGTPAARRSESRGLHG